MEPSRRAPGPVTGTDVHAEPFHSHVSLIEPESSAPPYMTVLSRPASYAIAMADLAAGSGPLGASCVHRPSAKNHVSFRGFSLRPLKSRVPPARSSNTMPMLLRGEGPSRETRAHSASHCPPASETDPTTGIAAAAVTDIRTARECTRCSFHAASNRTGAAMAQINRLSLRWREIKCARISRIWVGIDRPSVSFPEFWRTTTIHAAGLVSSRQPDVSSSVHASPRPRRGSANRGAGAVVCAEKTHLSDVCIP